MNKPLCSCDMQSINAETGNSLIDVQFSNADSIIQDAARIQSDSIDPIKITAIECDSLITLQTFHNNEILSTEMETIDNLYDIDCLTEIIYRNGKSPFLSKETKTWWEFDDNLQKYVDTGVKATGGGGGGISELANLNIGPWTYNGTEEVTIGYYEGDIEFSMMSADGIMRLADTNNTNQSATTPNYEASESRIFKANSTPIF